MESTNTTLLKALKGGAIAGVIGAILNNVWSIVAGVLGATIPPNFILSVILSSVLPLLIGALVYFTFITYSPNGKVVWLAVTVGFTLLSFYPVFNTLQLPDGTVLDGTFPLLAGPMHIISGTLAGVGIPKFSK